MKKILSLMIVLLVTLTITGCGSKETNTGTNGNNTSINENENSSDNAAFLNKTYNGEYYDGNTTTSVAFKVTKFNKEKGILEISVNNTTYKLTKNEIIDSDYGTVYYAEYEDLSLNMNYRTDDSFSIKASIAQNSNMNNNEAILKLAGIFK